MLLIPEQAPYHPVIALNETTDIYELLADWSYLADWSPASLTFDFSHTAPHLTQTDRFEHLPGSFSFHPVDRLVAQLAFIRYLRRRGRPQLFAVLPPPDSAAGRHLTRWGVPPFLRQWHIPLGIHPVETIAPARLDPGLKILLPLTDLPPTPTGLAEQIFSPLASLNPIARRAAANLMTKVIRLIGGGLTGVLYFPRTGYLEFSVLNQTRPVRNRPPELHLAELADLLETPLFAALYPDLLTLYGSLQVANGLVTLITGPDGSYTTWQEQLDLPLAPFAGLRVTAILQLPPTLPADINRDRLAALEQTFVNRERMGND